MRDGCLVCNGVSGGVPGNENVIDGVVICDYCTATLIAFRRARAAQIKAEGRGQ